MLLCSSSSGVADATALFVSCRPQLGLLQFKDLNPHKSPFQRTYANQVKRCEEMARRLRFFTDQIEKSGHTLNQNPSLERTFDLDELEVKLESLERELLEVNANSDKLRRSHSELVELQLVLEKAGAFFEDARSTARTDDDVRSFHTQPEHFIVFVVVLLPRRCSSRERTRVPVDDHNILTKTACRTPRYVQRDSATVIVPSLARVHLRSMILTEAGATLRATASRRLSFPWRPRPRQRRRALASSQAQFSRTRNSPSSASSSAQRGEICFSKWYVCLLFIHSLLCALPYMSSKRSTYCARR